MAQQFEKGQTVWVKDRFAKPYGWKKRIVVNPDVSKYTHRVGKRGGGYVSVRDIDVEEDDQWNRQRVYNTRGNIMDEATFERERKPGLEVIRLERDHEQAIHDAGQRILFERAAEGIWLAYLGNGLTRETLTDYLMERFEVGRGPAIRFLDPENTALAEATARVEAGGDDGN